ncbi:replication-associated protein [Crucivirus-534]|nr:replication-associated protein [Crucivirus-534]
MSTSTRSGKSKKSGTHSEANNAKRIRWVFRSNAQQLMVIDDEETRSNEAAQLIGKMIDHVDKFAFQLESAPTTGYLHHQGYFELVNKKAKTWILKNIHAFEFLAPAKGSPKQAWAYSVKNDTRLHGPWMLGEPTAAESGAQMKTELFVQAVLENKMDMELFLEHPSCMMRHSAGADRLRNCMKIERTTPLEVYLFYGPPGTGKTDFAYEQGIAAGYTPYELPLGKDFWLTGDAFGKKYIILDEFKANLTLKDLLKLLDKRPQKAPIKGGFVHWMPDIIVITTNVSPWKWYTYNDRDFEREALFRRIHGCYAFKKNAEGIPKPEIMDIHNAKEFEDMMPKPVLTIAQLQANERMKHLKSFTPKFPQREDFMDM